VKTLLVLAALFVYVAIVEQRTPVLRAALMAAVVVVASHFYRRLDLVNSAAISALLLLIARPLYVNRISAFIFGNWNNRWSGSAGD
jgi:predicted membrane metal-binding protein